MSDVRAKQRETTSMRDPRTKREIDEEAGADVDAPDYVSGDEGDPYADETGNQSETLDGMD
jgi:hypothetical protein